MKSRYLRPPASTCAFSFGRNASASSVIGADEMACRARIVSTAPSAVRAVSVHRREAASHSNEVMSRPIRTCPPCALILSRAASHIMPGPLRG